MTFDEKHTELLKFYNNNMIIPIHNLLYDYVDSQIKSNFKLESKILIKLSDKISFEMGGNIHSNEYILFVNLLYKLTFKKD